VRVRHVATSGIAIAPIDSADSNVGASSRASNSFWF